MLNENKLEQMVIDLKLGETSESLEEMLEKISKDNIHYQEIVKANNKKEKSKQANKDFDEEMLFLEFRGWFCVYMEQDILSYLKGVF